MTLNKYVALLEQGRYTSVEKSIHKHLAYYQKDAQNFQGDQETK